MISTPGAGSPANVASSTSRASSARINVTDDDVSDMPYAIVTTALGKISRTSLKESTRRPPPMRIFFTDGYDELDARGTARNNIVIIVGTAINAVTRSREMTSSTRSATNSFMNI